MTEYDVVVRGGLVVDGSGDEPFEADVAIRDGKIAEIGKVLASGTEEIDARGKIVTPGFVDIHTHFDGQITWENHFEPASNHGVTTVLMGSCGVGFAPCRKSDRPMTVKLMEGVEDIPGVVMDAGVPFNWETFPEYMDAIEQRHADADFATQIPHSPLRVYVMGQRGADMEPPTEDELTEMRRLTAQAIRAGSFGVSTSRALTHRFPNGKLAPSVKTETDELVALAQGLADAGNGIFQMVPNLDGDADTEFGVMRKIVEASGRPLSFSLVNMDHQRHNYAKYLKHLDEAAAADVPISAQFLPRPAGILFGLDLSFHPLSLNPSYRPIADLPLAEKVRIMQDPEFRAKLVSEEPDDPNPNFVNLVSSGRTYFVLGDPPVYNRSPEDSLQALAQRTGRPLKEVIYDALLEDDGHAVIYSPSTSDVPRVVEEAKSMFERPNAIMGLGDGGAHYGMVCDASTPTYLLSDWVRDKRRGTGLSLPMAIKSLTLDPATTIGLQDRGLIRVGMKADLNVIDLDSLKLHKLTVKRDLPADGRRLVQGADGYVATLVSGVVTRRYGKQTGELPGRLIRNRAQAA